jgi:hypothetical protein
MKKNVAVLGALFFIISVHVSAQTLFQKSFINKGNKITRTMTIPQGWEASFSLKSVQRSEETYIKSTQSWRTAEGSFCVLNLPMENETFEKIIEFDIHNYTEFSEDAVTIKDGNTIFVDNNKSIAVVKLITGAADAPFLAIAYIPEKSTVTVVTFYAENENFFNENMTDFENFVRSYTYAVQSMPYASANSFY